MSIVPSTGLPTARYAAAVANENARARSVVWQTSISTKAWANPLRNWDRITPLLPLAPQKAPPANPPATSDNALSAA